MSRPMNNAVTRNASTPDPKAPQTGACWDVASHETRLFCWRAAATPDRKTPVNRGASARLLSNPLVRHMGAGPALRRPKQNSRKSERVGRMLLCVGTRPIKPDQVRSAWSGVRPIPPVCPAPTMADIRSRHEAARVRTLHSHAHCAWGCRPHALRKAVPPQPVMLLPPQVEAL